MRNIFIVITIVAGSVELPLCCKAGEILVGGDIVIPGYYHNEDENEKIFVDGWFETGDIVIIDEYGLLHITGKIKSLIIIENGENILAEVHENKWKGN